MSDGTTVESLQEVLTKLSTSKFRNSFSLNLKDHRYIFEKSMTIVTEHAKRFVTQRLSSASPANDGRQTPFRGHPVFIAQHATATCCRACLQKWHEIEKGAPLTESQIKYVVGVIVAWIEQEIETLECDEEDLFVD